MTERIGPRFFRETAYSRMEPSEQARGLPQPPLEMEYDRDAPSIELPGAGEAGIEPVPVGDAIARRRSVRRYSRSHLRLEELSFLLWCTQGVERKLPGATLRTVPSAGARHCFETFILANLVDGLAPGLYRYLALEHRLLEIDRSATIRDAVAHGCLDQAFVGESAAVFLWAADAVRMTWRYGQRGYRYLLLDAGHICQNLYLAAETVGCGVCAVAAFDDGEINRVLGLDGESRFMVYAAALGKRV